MRSNLRAPAKRAGENYAEALLVAGSTEAGATMPALSEAQALNLIPNVSAKLPQGHNYTDDIAAVLGLQGPNKPINPRPSADQYASFGVMLNALQTPGSGNFQPTAGGFYADELG